MNVAIVADHNGHAMKDRLIAWLEENGHAVDDRSGEQGDVVDYPPLCEDVCREVVEGRADFAVVVGGSGSGEAICCNKIPGIRAALCLDLWVTEIARGNNDANVLVTGAKAIAPDYAILILKKWLETPFKGAEHARRVEMITKLERGESLLD